LENKYCLAIQEEMKRNDNVTYYFFLHSIALSITKSVKFMKPSAFSAWEKTQNKSFFVTYPFFPLLSRQRKND